MGREEAISLLLKASGEDDTDDILRKWSQGVVELLGCLALGVIHAGAVIRQGLYSFEEYCDAYKNRRKELLNLQPAQASSDYQYTVYTTWEISVISIRNVAARSTNGCDEASTTATNALDLLNLIGFCHFDGIEEKIFESFHLNIRESGKKYPWWATKVFSIFRENPTLDWDPLPFRQAASLLRSYSLIQITDNTISLHPLVHSWTRDSLDAKTHLHQWTISLTTLAMAVEGEDGTYHYERRLLPHVRSCLDKGDLDDFLVEDDAPRDRVSVLIEVVYLYHLCRQDSETRVTVRRAIR